MRELGQRIKQPSFEEKRKQWKSQLDKQAGPSLFVTVLPALLMCVFLVLAAPYIKKIIMGIVDPTDSSLRKVDTSGEVESAEPVLPPPDPEAVYTESYLRQWNEMGVKIEETPDVVIAPKRVALKKEKIPQLDIELPVLVYEPPNPVESSE